MTTDQFEIWFQEELKESIRTPIGSFAKKVKKVLMPIKMILTIVYNVLMKPACNALAFQVVRVMSPDTEVLMGLVGIITALSVTLFGMVGLLPLIYILYPVVTFPICITIISHGVWRSIYYEPYPMP